MDNIKIGHNKPPSMIETVGETVRGLSGWLSEHPIISTEAEAREGKVWTDRAALCVRDAEDERTNLVRPLSDKVKEINNRYKEPRELLERIANELKSRLSEYLLGEEAKRIAAAEEARKRAEQAERIARAAEQREEEVYLEASAGVLGLDIADATANADQAFAEHQKAQRQAQVAERETKVKIGGGFRRSLSLRETEVIYIEDALAVFKAVGPTEGIKTELLKAARVYRRLHGEYPKGIAVTLERGT